MKDKRSFNLGTALLLAILLAGVLNGCSGNSPAAEMQKARRYERKGAYRKAAIELREVIKKQPQNVAARLLLGKVSLRLGEPVYAQRQFESAEKLGAAPDSVLPLLADSLLGERDYKKLLNTIQIGPSQSSRLQAKLLAARGQAFLRLGKRNEASVAFDKALRLVSGQPRALIGQAELALQKKDLATASQKLDAALEKDPTEMLAWLLKGNVAYQQKHWKDAEADYRRAIKDPMQGEPLFDKYLARGRLVTVLMQQGDDSRALKEINVLLQEAPQQPLPNYLRAVLAYREKHYNLAEEKLEIALKAAPDFSQALALLAASKEKQGEDDQAEMYLTSALSADPTNPNLVIALAHLQMHMGDPRRALVTLNNAVGRGVTNAMVMGMLEKAIMVVGQNSHGLAYLQQNILPETSNPSVQMGLARAFIAHGINESAVSLLEKVRASGEGETAEREGLLVMALLRSGREAKALQVAKAATSRYPGVALWHNLLGDVYVALRRNDAAHTQFLTARRLDPENVTATISLASLALREQKFREAINELSYLHGNNGEPAGTILMARAYVGLGHQKKAVVILQKALDKYPNAREPLLILVRYELSNHRPQIAKTLVEQALVHHPDNAGLMNLLGVTQLADKANQDAVKSFLKAVHEAPDVVEFQLDLARAQIADNRPADAVHTLSHFRSAHPGNVAVLSLLAVAQMYNKNPKAAFAIAKDMREKSNRKGQGDFLEGNLFEMQHDYANAARAFERAARISGNGAVLVFAVTARGKGHIDPPEQPLLNWVQEHKGDVAQTAFLAQWYLQHNNFRQAAFWYQKLTVGHGRYVPFMLNNLAMVYLQLHNPKALPTAERAYRLAPHVAAIADTLGWIQLQRGDFTGADKHLKEAVAEDPDSPEMRYHLAYLLAQSGKRSEALKELTRALETKRKFENKAAAEALKERLKG